MAPAVKIVIPLFTSDRLNMTLVQLKWRVTFLWIVPMFLCAGPTAVLWKT
jgi:hypothetical protein